jgi:GNAT superfamily N-acetyltransferase
MKRIPMSLQLTPQTHVREWPARAVQAEDSNDLAILLYAAFRGTIDDEGEPFSAAVREIEKTMAGDYGHLIPECSFVIQSGEFISSACLISWYEPVEGPFVVFTMTRPESKGQGLARFLLQESINTLFERGDRQLTLIVTEGNQPAQHLYESLGFKALKDE